MKSVKIIECPRDAMQGIKMFIPTEKKVQYIQSLLAVGFDTIDFGSFVSPKAIPQMQDTAEVLAQLDLSKTKSKLLAIIANVRGAESAAIHDEIKYLGFPFSISENFQMRMRKINFGQCYFVVGSANFWAGVLSRQRHHSAQEERSKNASKRFTDYIPRSLLFAKSSHYC